MNESDIDDITNAMAISEKKQLEEKLTLTENEEKWFQNPSPLPLLVSDSFFSLINSEDPEDPIRKQVIPDSRECSTEDLTDPLEEVGHSVSERFIHRYGNRGALLTTDRCFTYCRHCFRRRFTGTSTGPISDEELERVCTYLRKHTEIEEILLTGGDMFTLSDERIDVMLSRLKETREDIILRLCTRAVATYPERFTPRLMEIIRKHDHGAPFMLMVQFNHPRELTPAAVNAVSMFTKSGIPAFNQCVLLKGVNDDVDVLAELSHKLLYNRIKPYYLFQGDLVRGTAHLRTTVEEGLRIEKELRHRLSGLGMPQYTIDLPEGGGKVILTHQYLMGKKNGHLEFETPDGLIRYYPEA